MGCLNTQLEQLFNKIKMCCLVSKSNSKINIWWYLASTTYSNLTQSTFTVHAEADFNSHTMTLNLGSEARNVTISYCNLSYLFWLNRVSFDSLVLIAPWLYDYAVTKAKGEITANTTDATVLKDPYTGKRFLSRWGKFPSIQEFFPAVLPFPWPDFSRSFP